MTKWKTIAICAWAAVLPLVTGGLIKSQEMQQSIVTLPAAPTGCSFGAPQTSQWLASNSAGGSGEPGFNDAVGGNPATNTSNDPSYSASGTFPNPYLTFNGSSQYLNLSTAISNAFTTYSFLFLVNMPSTSGTVYLNGPYTGPGLSFQLSGGQQKIKNTAGTTLASGTSTSYAANTNYALAMTYNSATGTYTFWYLSGGAAHVDGSGTGTSQSLSYPIAYFALANEHVSPAYGAYMSPEMDFYNGTWTSANMASIAAYVHCKDGI